MILNLKQLVQLHCNTRGLCASNINDDTATVLHFDQGQLHLRMMDKPKGVAVWGWLNGEEGEEVTLDDDELLEALELHKPYLPVGVFP